MPRIPSVRDGGAPRTMYAVARTTVDPLTMVPTARAVVRELDPQLAIIANTNVKRRTRELGIRMALGARPRAVMTLVLKQGMLLAASSLLLGVVVALLVTRLIERLLFGIAPSDPLTHIAVSAALALVAFGAIWLPARRALRTDPAEALRVD